MPASSTTMPSQSNTQKGDMRFIAGEDFTGLDPCLVNITTNATPEGSALRPGADTDTPSHVLVDPNYTPYVALTQYVTCRPLESGQPVRIKMKGTGVRGDLVCPALVATAADKGKIRKVPAGAGTYWVVGKLLEDAADLDYALVQPMMFLKTI